MPNVRCVLCATAKARSEITFERNENTERQVNRTKFKRKENHRKTDENEMDPVLGTTNQIQFRH